MAKAESVAQPAPRRRMRPSQRVLLWLLGLVVAALAVLAIAAALLDSSAGRRFVSDQIEALQPESGLRIRVGRIEGSIYRQVVLRDVRLYDPEGMFLRTPEARLDWRPLDFVLRNRLTINDLTIPSAELLRIPKLRPGDPDQPILPDFDIAVRRLSVARLAIRPAVAGRAALVGLQGRADIRSGTADVRLDARQIDGGDRVQLGLIAAPDRGDFDVDANLVAAHGGVIGGLLGLDRAVTGVIRGQGDWQRWRGALLADAGTQPLARLQLSATDGLYTARGRIQPDLLISNGLVARLSRGGVSVDASGRFAERRLDGTLALISAGLQLDLAGEVDLARNRFSNVRANAWARNPRLLLDRLDGQNLRLALLVDGAMSGPRFEYRLTAPWVAFGTTRLTGLEATGEGIAGRAITSIPVDLRVARVTGFGDLAEGLARNLRAQGLLQWRGQTIAGDNIRIRSDGLDGRLAVAADLTRGSYQAAWNGALPGLEIPGLGRVDLLTDLDLRPQGGGLAIAGRASATMRRLDNDFLRNLAGGLPRLDTNLSFGPDGILRLSNLRVRSPLLTFTGQGQRRRDGTFLITGRGVHRSYGPVRVTIDGPISRPRVDLTLERPPIGGAGLAGVTLQLTPNANGFGFTTGGQSILGPFTAEGNILLPPGGSAVIDIARLSVGGTTARGRLTAVTGGLTGNLTVAGGGLDGRIALAMVRGIQRAEVHMTARNAQFAGPPPIMIGRGTIDAVVLLDPRGTDVQATFSGSGFRRGNLSIARFQGDARLVDGSGLVRASIAGARGRSFALQLTAGVTPDRIRINAAGTYAGRPIALVRPAVLRREDGGWRLEPAEIRYAGGTSRVSGLLGATRTEIDARLRSMPLSLIDSGYPQLGLGGMISGDIVYRSGSGAPTGNAQLRITGLTRSGLTSSSPPLDVALNAALTGDAAAVRALVRDNGRIIGRIQARLAPLGSGDMMTRLLAAPLMAQLRYDGPADTLWNLTGVETIAISGPLAVAADATGTLTNPRISGVMRMRDGRVESAQTGTVITNASAVGRFDGSRLQLRNISGETRGGGRVSGVADIDLAAANGFGMDVRIDARNALLIERDDLVARVTGPIRLASSGSGGEISGDVRLDSGSFRLGRAAAAEALPVINVREINLPTDRPQPRAVAAPWRLNLRARGEHDFEVTGLGLESEWATDISVRGDVTNFALTGTAELVRGDYVFAGRRFELDSGTIRFTGATPIDPVLDIVAVDDIQGIDATIRVRGTGLRPEITFSSVPALPEDELLSRILFGSSITDISVAEAAQLGVALASLRDGGGGLDPINAIRRSIGLDRLRILPANTEIRQGTSIAAGVNIGRRVYVEVITDGQGYSATRAEFKITRWLALLASISTIGRQSVNLQIQRNY